MKNTILFSLFLTLLASCSSTPLSERTPASGSSNIISSPKTIGFIFLGKIKSHRDEVSSAEYVLKEDLEREPLIEKNWTSIGDFVVRPGTVLRLTKNTVMYTKPADYIRGVDKNSAVPLKEGQKVRILQYNYNSLTNMIAIIEVLD